MVIGVLALQGAFAKHAECLRSLGSSVVEVRKPQHLESCQGLIIPGGESTTLSRLLQSSNLKEAILEFARVHALMGTCAGLILMSNAVMECKNENNHECTEICHLNLLDITILRNAYGRQLDSFETTLKLTLPKQVQPLQQSKQHEQTKHAGEAKQIAQEIPALFIRAPKIQALGKNVQVLASFQGIPVAVQQGKHIGLSFHPELTPDRTLHQYFLTTISRGDS